MNILDMKKLITSVFSLIITFGCSPVYADDIEIYEAISRATQATGDGDFNPNVLFVLDNSGSMDNWVIRFDRDVNNPDDPYDPNVNYIEQFTGNSTDSSFYVYDNNFDFLHRLRNDRNVCQASRDFLNDPANATTPFFLDQLVQWTFSRFNRDFWSRNTINSSFAGRVVECEDDHGNHGNALNRADASGLPSYLNRCTGRDRFGRLRVCRNDPQYRNTERLEGGQVFPYETDPEPERYIVSANYHFYLLLSNPLTLTEVANQCDMIANFDRSVKTAQVPVDRAGTYLCERRLDVMKRVLTDVIEGAGAGNVALSGVNAGLMRFNLNDVQTEVQEFCVLRDRFGRCVQFQDFLVNSTRPDGSLIDGSSNGGTLVDAVQNLSGPDNPADVDANGDPVTADGTFKTNREDLVEKIDAINYEGNTPLSEALYESYRYFAGEGAVYSERTATGTNNAIIDSKAIQPADNPDGTVNNTAGNFASPRTSNQCQDNFVVLLSDGEPTVDEAANSAILDLPGNNVRTLGPGEPVDPNDTKTACGLRLSDPSDPNSALVDDPRANCLDEVTNALREDLNVSTYTIAFAEDIPILAEAGDVNLTATNATGLRTAFQQIIADIQQVDNDNFVAPAVTVNAFNRLQNRSDIYYAVFTPDLTPRWNGNIKKYRIRGSDATIRDALDNNAIDNTSGFFSSTSKSFWSNEVDGPDVEIGGFTDELPRENNRNIYASLNSNNVVTPLALESDADPAQRFKDAIIPLDSTGAVIGVLAGTGTLDNASSNLGRNFDEIVRWSLGEDIESVNSEPPSTPARTNEFAGESIHSTPFVLSYGTSDAAPKDIVFIATNQGILHAVTGQGQDEVGGATGDIGGEEQWAYVPDRDLLRNLGGYYNRELAGDQDHIYGLDGQISFDVRRADDNSVEDAKLFLGQRRGGNKYFAIDITNADGADPGLPVDKLWTIEGDSTLPAGTSDGFPRLGQTWARPIVTNFRTCDVGGCEQVRALVLGGGYDPQYDNPAVDVADLADSASQNTLGNAIYIVRAEDDPNNSSKRGGDVLWASSNSRGGTVATRGDVEIAEMNHSIPTPPTVLDLNRDGAIDAMFAVDLAGQVFRYDFVPTFNTLGVQTGEERTGGRIADLQENNVNRRFYNPIDAVFLPPTNVDDQITGTNDAAPARIALVTGTGYRASPLQAEPAGNRYYVVYDENITGPQRDGTGDPVYDYVPVGAGAGTTTREIQANNIPALSTTAPFIRAGNIHQFGYFIPLEDQSAEKIINPSLISSFQLIGVSYLPTAVQNNVCSAAPGVSNAYRHDLLTGEQEIIRLQKPGVSAAPVLVFLLVTDPTTGKESLKPVVVIGTEPFDAEETFNITDPDLGRARKEAWWESGRANN